MLMYVGNFLLFSSLCVAQLSDTSQPVSVQAVTLGDSATIECYIKSEMKKRVWYKVTTGKRLQLVAAFNPFYNRSIFADKFRHHSLKFDSISCNLTISAITRDDVGTYFCGVMHLNDIQFGSGTFLMITGANVISDSVVQQPESMSVQPGGSVTLSCSVHSSHCAEEHASVKWLKNSPHSAPQMIHYSGKKCQKTESGATTCEYNLLMRNLSLDDAGTYYCVVTSCEQTLSGNGTRLDIRGYTDGECKKVEYVSREVVPAIILGVLLAFSLCLNIKRCCCHCIESKATFSATSTTSAAGDQYVHQAGVREGGKIPRQRDNTWSECVYFLVQQQT